MIKWIKSLFKKPEVKALVPAAPAPLQLVPTEKSIPEQYPNVPVVVIDFNKAKTYSKREITEMIFALEEQVKNAPQIEIPLEHHFSKGVYAREMRVPPGVLIIGKMHKFQNLNILLSGEVSVLSIDGVYERKQAPWTFVASPGAKRVILAHTETVWTTVLGTDHKDPEQIKDLFTIKSLDEVEALFNEPLVQLEESKVCQ